MPYLMSDDRKPWNNKVVTLSDAAYRLYDTAKHYAAGELTDGFLLPLHLETLPRFKRAALTELLGARLVHGMGEGCGTKTCPDGRPGYYLVHDYLQWNKSKAWWVEKRIKDAERLAKWRAQNADSNGGETS